MNTHVKKYKNKKKKDGICIDCSAKATHGVYCARHRRKYNLISAELREKRRKNNVCIRCGIDLDPFSVLYCTPHKLESQRRQKKSDVALHGGTKIILRKNRMDKEKLASIRQKLIDLAEQKKFKLTLSPNQQKVLNLRILTGAISLRKAAEIIGLSHEKVRQIEEESAERFRHFLITQGYMAPNGTIK